MLVKVIIGQKEKSKLPGGGRYYGRYIMGSIMHRCDPRLSYSAFLGTT